MSGEINFEFEELPLIVDLGFEAGLVNGSATIAYEDDGEWFVRAITLDGSRKRTPDEIAALVEAKPNTVIGRYYENKSIEIDRASYSWLHGAICDQLENGRFKDQIDHKIIEELSDAGVSLSSQNAEHSTFHIPPSTAPSRAYNRRKNRP